MAVNNLDATELNSGLKFRSFMLFCRRLYTVSQKTYPTISVVT